MILYGLKEVDATFANKVLNTVFAMKSVALLKQRTFQYKMAFIQQFLVHRITTF